MAVHWSTPLAAAAALALIIMPPAQGEPIREGFTATLLPHADDISGPDTNVGFEVNFLGQSFSSLFVNSNGNLTFGAPLSAFSPIPLNQLGAMIVAPFFADVDTSIAGDVVYGTGSVNGRPAFAATWSAVPYHSPNPTGLNSFQAVLIERADTGAGNFDVEYNYGQVEWESGDFSGGSGGRGGNSARIGFSGGTPETTFEVAGSGVPGAITDDGSLSLTKGLFASETPGRYLFSSRGGAFNLMGMPPRTPNESPTTPPPVRPTPDTSVPIPPPVVDNEEPLPTETPATGGEVTPTVPDSVDSPFFPTPVAPIGVPEPATLLLASLGGGLIGTKRIRAWVSSRTTK